MKTNIYWLLIVFIIGFLTLTFAQDTNWSKYVLIPCGLFVAYSFIIMSISAFNSFRRK